MIIAHLLVRFVFLVFVSVYLDIRSRFSNMLILLNVFLQMHVLMKVEWLEYRICVLIISELNGSLATVAAFEHVSVALYRSTVHYTIIRYIDNRHGFVARYLLQRRSSCAFRSLAFSACCIRRLLNLIKSRLTSLSLSVSIHLVVFFTKRLCLFLSFSLDFFNDISNFFIINVVADLSTHWIHSLHL